MPDRTKLADASIIPTCQDWRLAVIRLFSWQIRFEFTSFFVSQNRSFRRRRSR